MGTLGAQTWADQGDDVIALTPETWVNFFGGDPRNPRTGVSSKERKNLWLASDRGAHYPGPPDISGVLGGKCLA